MQDYMVSTSGIAGIPSIRIAMGQEADEGETPIYYH
jgi:hypothetical protein